MYVKDYKWKSKYFGESSKTFCYIIDGISEGTKVYTLIKNIEESWYIKKYEYGSIYFTHKLT